MFRSLNSPAPFRKIFEPQTECSIKSRLEALRKCCPKASPSQLQQGAKDKGLSLLDAWKKIAPTSGESNGGAKRKEPCSRLLPAKRQSSEDSLCQLLAEVPAKRQKCQESLGQMLAEVVAAESAQSVFLEEQEAAGPEKSKKLKRRTGKRALPLSSDFPQMLTCCACRETGLASSMVPCHLAEYEIKQAAKDAKVWAKRPASMRRGANGRTLSKEEYVAQQMLKSARLIETHVYCAACLRAYLMGTRVHGGKMENMFCPGCTKEIRDAAEINDEAEASYWCEECGMYHPREDVQDMTGLDLDGICSAAELFELQPLDAKQLTRVLGPMDVIRLRDLAHNVMHPPKLSPGLVQQLRKDGARRCTFCKQASVLGDGCNAVLCEFCGLIFNWHRAKRV